VERWVNTERERMMLITDNQKTAEEEHTEEKEVEEAHTKKSRATA
jgi:hypothetical protein